MRRLAGIFVAWTLVGLLSIAPGLLAQLGGEGRPLRPATLVFHLESVWLWAALTPLIWWLAARFPVRRRGVARGLAVHFLLANGLNVVDGALDRLILPLLGLRPGDGFLAFCRDQLFINVFSYAATAAVGQALAKAAEARRRQLRESELAAELARAQLRALEMQLRPHFLFNALHGIGALVSRNESQRAIRTIAELGDLLRALLRAEGHEATVHEELELTLRYLRIEEMRFGDRLETRVSVTPEALPARVPRLVLQPLVENAVRYGVETTAGPARIDLRAMVEDDMVWLTVRDDGGAATRRKGEGIGLANTRARLQRLYGDRHRLELRPVAGGGVEARVGVPYHVGPVEPAS